MLNDEVSKADQEAFLPKKKEYEMPTLFCSDYFDVVNDLKWTNTYPPVKGTPMQVRTEPKVGRNDICPKCNSGKKYKKCCLK